jgi:hypothetical protein
MGSGDSAAVSGAAAGAAAGSVVPGIGTAIGAAVGGGMGLLQAANQARAQREADKQVEESVAEAQKQLEQKFLDAVQVPMGAYNNAVLQNVAQQQQSIGALQEAGPRELAGGIGRVNEVANQGTTQLTENIADRLYALSLAQAQEKSQTAGRIAALKQAQAQGAQIASMAAQKAKIASQQNALNSFGNAITIAEKSLTPVYSPNEKSSEIKNIIPNTQQPAPIIQQPVQDFTGQFMGGGTMFGGSNSMLGEIIGFDFMGNPIYKQ